jgi:predicted HTH transcriptional regulator
MIVKQRLFISSVQKEFAAERRALKEFVHGDPLLKRFFEVFLFEDIPAAGRRADQVYLAEVDRCAVYVALLGKDYGYEDGEGISPTEREFDRAMEQGKECLVFIVGQEDKARHPKAQAFIRKANELVTRRRIADPQALNAALNASLVEYLEKLGVIQSQPFEERPCAKASLDDIDADALADFVHKARHERQFPLPEHTPVADVLTHLNLLDAGRPTHAAMLLFAANPQRFIPAAEIRCMHFHGTQVQRPVPFYRIYKGTLFEQVEHAADFVLSVTNRAVGTRAESIQAPVTYEIPPDVIREAVINAVAHRDYAAAGEAIQVSVFADRVEVWNPGTLLPPLTPADLRKAHRSVARNPRLCDALFQAHYIEKYGTGTLMMIDQCRRHGLPEPRFAQDGHEFMLTLWRHWLTPERLAALGLNDRQRQALDLLRGQGRITNTEYQAAFQVAKRTAHRDLAELAEKGLVEKVGSTGKGTYYVLAQGAAKGPNGPAGEAAETPPPKGATKGPKGS